MSDIATDLRILARYIRGIIEPDSKDLLGEVADQVPSVGKGRPVRKGRIAGLKWEISIQHNRSLRFIRAETDHRLQPDLFCTLASTDEGEWPLQGQNLVLRIWSLDKKLSYRKEWDSISVAQRIRQNMYRRVIMRLHFDRANPGQEGPLFHLQYGGRPIDDQLECSWFPGEVDVPRLQWPPVDIVLACELVVANFFPSLFHELNNTPEWQALMSRAQCRVLSHYYETCHSTCSTGGQSVLKRLWNVAQIG
jgi:hypothetical protein